MSDRVAWLLREAAAVDGKKREAILDQAAQWMVKEFQGRE